MDPHKEIMDNFLKSLTNARTSSVLSYDKYQAVLKHLKDPNTKVDRNSKHWVHKNKGFQLMDLPGLDVSNAIVVPIKDSRKTNTSSAFLRVVPESKLYNIVKQVHCKEMNHAGYKKCLDYVSVILNIFYVQVYYLNLFIFLFVFYNCVIFQILLIILNY